LTAEQLHAPVRVLRIISRTNVGGPALQVSALSRGLDPARYEQRMLVGHVEPDEADYLGLREHGVSCVRVDGLGRAPRPHDDLRALRAIAREITQYRPHIVHTHTTKAGTLGRLAAIAARVPAVVHTYHGHVLRGYFSRPVSETIRAVERALARRTTVLVSVGAQVRDELLAAGVGRREQYRVVPPGVRLLDAPDRADARRALGLPDTGPVVAFVARITQIKRPDRFAEVAALVVARRPDVTFVVVGEGQCLPELQRACAPLGERVRFVGWRADVEAVYAAVDAVVLTSDNEGMPVSLIEAASAGVPAVTTDVGSAGEVVADGVSGFVVAVDAAAVAHGLLQLLDDPELAHKMGDLARERAHELFAAERLVGDMAAIYDEISRPTRVRAR
jgi:glycosyltransferase involved in cell wall biosynthesis